MTSRFFVMLLASVGGVGMCAAGFLFAAGHPFLATGCALTGFFNLSRANQRLCEQEQALEVMYNRAGEDQEL